MPYRELNKKLTKPQLTELAAFLYMRYEAHKSLSDESTAPIIKTNKGKVAK